MELSMTMLAMWLGERCVALAADSKETASNRPVEKVFRLPSRRILFGYGFSGDGASEWLSNCSICSKHPRNYRAHWVECSQAQTIDELRRFVQKDLRQGSFPSDCHLELWIAGMNDQDRLEAFVLDGTGRESKRLSVGNVMFNDTSELVGSHFGRKETGWWPGARFRDAKRILDTKGVELSGAKALKETCKQLIEHCERIDHPSIGGPLRFEIICR
jgi:hypothetical protein